LEEFLDFVIIKLRSGVGVGHARDAVGGMRVASCAKRDGEGGTDGTAGVAGGGREVHSLEGGLETDFAVGDRVHGATAGEGKVGASIASVERVEQGE
jgi:hypothetical protein